MGLKNSLKKIFGIKKEEPKSSYEMVPTNLDIVIDNDELIVTLGQWMGMYPDTIKSGGNGFYVYSHLEASDYLRKHKPTVKERDQIENRFASILMQAGYDIEDICVLDEFDSENLRFIGTFFSLTGDAEFNLRFGDFFEEPRNLRIAHNGSYSIYNYNSKPNMITLDTVTKDIDDTRKFHRYVSEFTYYGDLYDDENRLEVEVKYPESLGKGDSSDNPYVDTVRMEEIISGITFPCDIEDVCSRISEALSIDAELFPKVCVIVKKKINGKDRITDEAYFKDGKFEKLIITKNGRRIIIDKFNNWTYDTDTHTVNHMAEHEVSYGIKGMPIEQFEAMPTPQELVDNATSAIEEVKGMSLSLFKKKKQI